MTLLSLPYFIQFYIIFLLSYFSFLLTVELLTLAEAPQVKRHVTATLKNYLKLTFFLKIPVFRPPSQTPKKARKRRFSRGGVVTRQLGGGAGEANPPKIGGGYFNKSEYTKKYYPSKVTFLTPFLAFFDPPPGTPPYPPTGFPHTPPGRPFLGVFGVFRYFQEKGEF